MANFMIAWFFLVSMFLFYPKIGNATDCPDNFVNLKGTITNAYSTETAYLLETDQKCGGEKNDSFEIEILGKGKAPSSCKKGAHFKVSGTEQPKEDMDLDALWSVKVIPSGIVCN